MFLWWRRVRRTYRVSEDIAKSWPSIVASHGYCIDHEKSWAKNASHFLGFPFGRVIRPQRGYDWLDVGAERLTAPRGVLDVGYYVRVTFRPRKEDREIADEIDRILVASGAMAVEDDQSKAMPTARSS